MGSFLCPMMSGILAEQLGWEYPFYVIGVLGIAWFALWTLIVHEGPDSNPRYWWVHCPGHEFDPARPTTNFNSGSLTRRESTSR